jgi:hypothetical protein
MGKKHLRKPQKLYRMIHTDGLEQWRRKEANEKPSMLTYGLVGWLDHKTKMRMKCLCNIHRGYGKSWSMRKWATYAGRGDASRWVFDKEIHSASLDRGTHTSCTPPSSLLHLSLQPTQMPSHYVLLPKCDCTIANLAHLTLFLEGGKSVWTIRLILWHSITYVASFLQSPGLDWWSKPTTRCSQKNSFICFISKW